MNAAPTPSSPDTATEPTPPQPGAVLVSASAWRQPRLWWALALALSLLLSATLWQRLSNIQEQLARQSADSGANALEARTLARQAQDQARDTAARLAVTEARLSEVALQRAQLEELMQSLARSRDENLVVDIDASLRLAQQQAQLTGSVEPLLATLRTAEKRLARAAQPRLALVQRAIARDVDRIKSTTVSDTPSLLVKVDELVRLTDELPLVNDVAPAPTMPSLKPRQDDSMVSWWERSWRAVREELRSLVRVSRIANPEGALLAPEQAFFVRENLKLRLLNARLGLLARQLESSRADLASAAQTVSKYFDTHARTTQTAVALLQQLQGQMKTLELPRVDDTLAALATVAAGR